MYLAFTEHARVRQQQRAIPPLMVDLLHRFGSQEPAGNGTTKLFFDKSARRRVMAFAGPLSAAIEEHLDIYAVVSASDCVITAAHRTERIRRRR
jgi:hypothetical protein